MISVTLVIVTATPACDNVFDILSGTLSDLLVWSQQAFIRNMSSIPIAEKENILFCYSKKRLTNNKKWDNCVDNIIVNS